MNNATFQGHRLSALHKEGALNWLRVWGSVLGALLTWPGFGAGVDEGRKVGLVLSGGGARGAAHVGVLRVLEEHGVGIDYIAGTSMGALVGALYASGMSPDEIESGFLSVNWDNAMEDEPPRQDRRFRRKRQDDDFLVRQSIGFKKGRFALPPGLRQGQELRLLLQRFTLPVSHVDDFSELSIPFRAVASNIVTGEMKELYQGNLGTALRASMSFPGLLAPVEIDGELYVDGGVTNNVPIDVARRMGAQVLIVVDVSTPLAGREDLESAAAIIGQLTNFLSLAQMSRQDHALGPGDILIRPDLGLVTTSAFGLLADAISRGEAAARAQAEALGALASDGPQERRAVRRHDPPVIDFVRIESDSKLSQRVLRARLSQEPGRPLDVYALEGDIRRIYGLDTFAAVYYELVEEDGKTGLVIHARGKSWGPGYLQLGLEIAADFGGNTNTNLGAAYTRTELNGLGGEWRTEGRVGEEPRIHTEFFQPLDSGWRFFLHPSAFFERKNVGVYRAGERLAEYRVTRWGGAAELGSELGTWGEVRLGLRRSAGRNDLRVGNPALFGESSFNAGEVFLRFSVDELDDISFPRSGTLSRVEWRSSLPGLGADQSFEQVDVELSGAKAWGGTTVIGALRYGGTTVGDAPVQDRFRLGGFLNLSGFNENELSGQHLAFGRLTFYQELGNSRLVQPRLGLSLEIGNTWERRGEVLSDLLWGTALFVGLDSPIGPLHLGVGLAKGGNRAAYLFAGRKF